MSKVRSPFAAYTSLAQHTAGGSANDSNGLQDVDVSCERCHSAVGIYNIRDDLVALFKWRINVNGNKPHLMMPTSEICLSAMLLATMARTGSSKALIMPWRTHRKPDGKKVGESQVLHVWILNSSIRFSAYAEGPVRTLTPAIKLLYREIPYAKAEELLESVNDNVQEITLPLDAIEEVRERLNNATSLLPSTDQLFQGWHVGLLERYEKEQTSFPRTD
jgi:ubiquitin-protein ligase E3 D